MTRMTGSIKIPSFHQNRIGAAPIDPVNAFDKASEERMLSLLLARLPFLARPSYLSAKTTQYQNFATVPFFTYGGGNIWMNFAKNGGFMVVKILEHIEGFRKAKGLTRAQLAALMGEHWSKEKIDKVLNSDHCPRAETLAEIMEALGMPTYPADWFRSKSYGDDE